MLSKIGARRTQWIPRGMKQSISMFTNCDAPPKGDLFDLLVEGLPCRHSFAKCQASTPYQKLKVAERDSTLHQLCIMVASCPSLRCSYRKKPVSCRGAKGLVTELSCPRFVMSDTVIVSKTWGTGYWLRSQLWHVTAAKPMNSCRDWAFSNSGPAFQLPMFSKCHALPKGDWFDMFVYQESFPAIPFGISKHPLLYQKLKVPESDSTLHQLCNMLASCPSLLCSFRKKRLSHAEKQSVWSHSCGQMYNTVIVPKTWSTGYWLRTQLWHVTAADQWTLVEIELLATLGWKWGCQSFSCPGSQSVTHCRKEICSTYLLNSSIADIPLRNATTSSALCLHFACKRSHPFNPFVEDSGFASHAKKQRVWSRSCCLQALLQYCDCALSCAMRLLQNQGTLVEIELLATVGWKRGCQPFSCPCSQNVTHRRKEICSTYLLNSSIADIPLRNAKHPLSTRSLRLLRAAVRSTSSALCLHFACKRSHPFNPFVEDSGFVSHVEKHRFGHGVVVSKVCYGILEPLFSHLPSYCNESILEWAFSNSRWEVWLPAFQLSMFAKRDAAERRFFRHTCLLWNRSLLSLAEAWSAWERQHTLPPLHYGCIMPIPSLRLQKKPVSCREAEGLVTELWFRGLVEAYSDLRWFHVTTT